MKEVLLHLEGMTCTSCANQIEKELNNLENVEAKVNFATSSATIVSSDDLAIEKYIELVEKLGYQASLEEIDEDLAIKKLKRQRDMAVVIGSFALLVSMIPRFQFIGWQWVLFILTILVHTYSAIDIHKAAYVAAKNRFVNMDTLISLGTFVALMVSTWTLFFTPMGNLGMVMSHSFLERVDSGGLYLEVAAVVPAFILMGRYFEVKSKYRNINAISALKNISAEQIEVLRDGQSAVISAKDIQLTDLLVVKPGERIVVDGVVVEGEADVDESIISGESLPLLKRVGSPTIAGSTPLDGELIIRPLKIGKESVIGQIEQLILASQAEKSQTQLLVDRISSYFVPTILFISAFTFIFWLISGESTDFALSSALAVLIIACPCALGLATPVAILVSSAIAKEHKILIRSSQALETSRKIDTIFLDKTGTITTGNLKVIRFQELMANQKLINAVSYALASKSTHPVAKAIARYQTVDLFSRVEDFKSIAGGGISAKIDNKIYKIGNFKFLETRPDNLIENSDTRLVGITEDGNLLGFWELADGIKSSSESAIKDLRKLGLKVVILTGDAELNSQKIATQVGVDEVFSELDPQGKVKIIEKYKDEGHKVAFVGDGLNDAAAMSSANLSIALASGSYVSLAASDINILQGDLPQVVKALRLGRKTLKTIKINLFWAFAYNTAMIPIAFLGYLQPIWAGAAMAFSSVFVISNSLLLKYRKF